MSDKEILNTVAGVVIASACAAILLWVGLGVLMIGIQVWSLFQ